MEQTLKVCVFGATGYTGIELLRLLSNHPYAEVVSATSQSHAGKRLKDLFPFLDLDLTLLPEPSEDFDIAFLCLPHESSLELVPKLLSYGKKVVDLSGAYRIKDPRIYPEFYGFEHPYLSELQRAVYGLPEIFRDEIKGSQLVANPGCYPTAVLIGLYPLLKHSVQINKVFVDGVSGVSGAGRKTSQRFHFPEMTENAFAYSVEKHRHTPEIEDVIRRLSGRSVKVRFTPKVVPMSRGMICTICVECEKLDIMEVYNETYKEEAFVKVVDEPPMTKYTVGTNMAMVYPYYDERSGVAVIVSVIDNLGKGASSQALQNMNIMVEVEETLGLTRYPLFP